MELATKRTYTALVTLKESARNSTRAQCAWDSGSVTVLGLDLLTRTQAGNQCPGSMWKKFLPHRLKKEQILLLLVVVSFFLSERCFKANYMTWIRH